MTTESLAAERADRPIHRYFAGQKTRFSEEWRDILRSGHLLYNLVHRDLTVRYKRSVVGALWTLLHPLLLVMILVIVFSHLFRFNVEHYEVYLLAGLLPWTFFAQTTVNAMAATAWNGSLMKRVRVPKSIFTLSTTISGLVNLAVSYIPLLLIMIVRGVPFRPSLLFLPVSFAILAVFTFGLSLALSTISIYFVDVREMYTVALTALLYLTPIIYPMTIIPAKWQPIIRANPLYYLIEIARIPFHAGIAPSMQLLGAGVAIALTSLLIGWMAFRRLSAGFYPHL
jgi:ABC-type polysaccharide/polyol phosphate export permease